MSSLTKIFELIQYNNYDELDKIIKNTKINLKLPNRKGHYLIPTTIKYRSKECFELLVESKYFDSSNSNLNGLSIAIEYYCNAPNESNLYYLMMLLNKNVKFELNVFSIIFNYGFPEIFNEYLLNILNQDNFLKIFSYSVLNISALNKVINIGINYNFINEEIACKCLICARTNFYEIISEFVNNNINVFTIKENVLKYFHKNLDSPSIIKYLVDNVNKFNPNLDLSELLIKYDHKECNYNYIVYIYYILINFESLKYLKSKFTNVDIIIKNIFNDKILETLTDYNTINYNKILIIIKTIELLFNEKYLNENSIIFESIVINQPNRSCVTHKYYNKLIILKFFIKFFENKNIIIPPNNINIPENCQVDIISHLPKKIKPIKSHSLYIFN
jgi:hypothetical protein